MIIMAILTGKSLDKIDKKMYNLVMYFYLS